MKKLILSLLLICILLIAGCAKNDGTVVVDNTKDSEFITLGALGPLTGVAAEYGENMRGGIMMAVQEINDAGGINGKKINVIFEDGRCEPKEATTGMTKLATVDRVPAIIGAGCSAETLAAAAIAEPNKVVMISPTSSAPKISDAGDYIFRDYPSDSFQGKRAAQYSYNDIKARTAAIIYVNDDWGNGIKDTFSEAFPELGGKVLATEAYLKGGLEFATQLTKIKAVNPDVVLLLGFPPETIKILKEAEELGLDSSKMLGADASSDASVAKETKKSGEGFRIIVPSGEFSKEKAAKFEIMFGKAPGIGSPQSYDAMYILAQVISEVGTDSTAIKDALYKVSYEGESGHIEFDENGDLKSANYELMQIVNGEWVKVK